MEPKINYVTLLILIILGVAVGNLASSFITSEYLHKQDKKEVSELPTKTPAHPAKSTISTNSEPVTRETVKLSPERPSESQTAPNATEAPVDSEQLIEQRRIDENGIRLSKKCNEWTVVHKDMNTPSSERGMNKHCAEFYDYLSFGTLPNSN